MSSRLSYQRTCDTTVMSVIKKTILLVIVYFSYCCASSIVEESNDLMYNNQFAVNIPNASEVLVQLIAEKHGFRSLGQVIIHTWRKKMLLRIQLVFRSGESLDKSSLWMGFFFLRIKTFIWSIHHWKGESLSTVIFFFNQHWSQQLVFIL